MPATPRANTRAKCTYLDPSAPAGSRPWKGAGVTGDGVTNGGEVASVPTVGVDPAVTDGVGGELPPTSASSPPGRDNDMSSSGMDMAIVVGAGVVGVSKMLWIGG